MKKIAIVGGGGHSKVIQDIIRAGAEYEIVALLDDKYPSPEKRGELIFAPVSYASQLKQAGEEVRFVIAIGDNRIRKQMAERLASIDAQFAVLIHPSAVISPSAVVEAGTVVMPYAVINADTFVGRHAIINTAAVIEHDNKIEDFAHISPNAALTGSVHVEEGVHIGAGAVVIPGKRIGAWSVVGAGAAVINDIPEEVTAVGTPAKIIQYIHESLD
ncbi:acetyltransferase [Pseudobacillus sp. FSL P4-0506]|uniref:acetyltransferase n=1 Tax=unclassified Pseudobacillus TaxID=2619284 RepID=UPI0030F7527B